MKKYSLILILAVVVGLQSCGDDFLSSSPTEKQKAGDPATESVILSNLGAAYQILLFDSYANNNYNSIVLMSDLRSDDIYKGGGDAGDQHQLYLLSLFTSTPQELPAGLWNIYYTGLARCNNVLIACENAVGFEDEGKLKKLEQYKAEAHFLRAYYMHLLWKFWGNIPYFEEPLIEPPYMTRQYTADEIYKEIMEDIDQACVVGALPMKVETADLGRVSRAAALLLKARVVMYQKDQSRYAEVTKDMAELINSGEYDLFGDFAAMWLDQNEFSNESVFEANHLPEGKTWASGWQGYGTNLPAFIAPNGLSAGDKTGDFKGGWGFGPVRQATWNIFEEGDTRREGSINRWDAGQYTARFQDTGLFMAKYSARVGYNPQGDVDLNYCNNLRIFRFAEALLNYAELLVIHGQAPVDGLTAQTCLDRVRRRAFGEDKPIPATAENIKLERRREFVGEGMRFWDIVRWGDTNLLTESTELSTRTWRDEYKYLPIPQTEMDRTAKTDFALTQNPGYN
ncbi:RagB/SusD family nutrient uptake outer membrane protein [Limibacterium fermenti]|mgnify:CR=1 FL=1|uniref:RagB/SusD family nutrient uptake outer membrane protein n=1 Tax=Limibacterium fermenti TaxID=3229863 RepID=UPI000E7E86F9|nr:RagB/SusD family nutrient uptake outer membrane protein [Porphyromonadaceae bacterium]